MKPYDFKAIEAKWQKKWEDEQYGKSEDFSDKPKHYHLIEFPYPSGAGLHVGHCMMYSATDAYVRMKRMQGFNVMYPMGWDAFGLPTENFAIKNKVKPQAVTKSSIETFKRQQKSLGYSFDWSREINTTDPEYYKWTQWIFLQFYKHAVVDGPSTGSGQGKLIEVADDDTTTPRLAFQAEMAVNWCPSCKIVLANEEVINGKCERCGTEALKRMQKQWLLRITAYADRLIKDLESVDYLDKIKSQQVNWIGKSEGALVNFQIPNTKYQIQVFTTRPDTLFGATYMVLAPEHALVENLKDSITNYDKVSEYVTSTRKKSDLERTELQKEKTGVELKGIRAINPVNGEKIPVFIADYVLSTYGTGAIMAVPAHDERDWEFARRFNLPIKHVVKPVYGKSNKSDEAEARNTITAIVRNKEGKFLIIRTPEFGWSSSVIGGIDEGESPEQAAEREVLEETGYHVKAVERIGGTVESHFYNPQKKVWRSRYDQPVLCELVNETPDPVSAEEADGHEVVWLTGEEALRENTYQNNGLPLEMVVKQNYAFSDAGVGINSEFLNNLPTTEAKAKMIDWLHEHKQGEKTTNFKLRDWIFSRQHYWGEPIPIVHCEKCGTVPVPEDQLPVTLPDVENYEPTDTGESPLAKITDWVNTTCPKCGGKAKRETDTMPNWAGSSWYYLAYAMQGKPKSQTPEPKEKPKSKNIFKEKNKELNYWMPVDIYNGGMEHTTLHLLYSRFWHKFLFDLGVVPHCEPYAKRIAHGMILGPDGQKMSKSRGNVINPDEMTAQFGADTLRAYIMFIGPYDQDSAWSMAGIQGVSRFLKRVWNNFSMVNDDPDSEEILIKLNQTIKGVTDDLEGFGINTIIAKLMEFNNLLERVGHINKRSYGSYLKLLFVATPHIASELWEMGGFTDSIEFSNWPEADPSLLTAANIEIVIQVNGKVRDKVSMPAESSDEAMKTRAFESEKITSLIKDKSIIKTIVIPGKLVNIVIN
ncbi:MAG TPA: class I tRNA ligase family protein [bacterium]|nr:class I tRNA ligase family protein [bacterium]